MENPTSNNIAPRDPSLRWMDEPKQQGTFRIISFCLSTLIICTWCTLHFDIPTRQYSVAHRFLLQMVWIVIALILPELLLSLAINQQITAGILLGKVLEFHPNLAKPRLLTCVYNWIHVRITSESISTQ